MSNLFHRGIGGALMACAALLALSACDQTEVDDGTMITLSSPKKGESYKVGSIMPVKWSTKGKGVEEVNAVDVELSPDSGVTWAYIRIPIGSIRKGSETWGNYPWTVLDTVSFQGEKFGLVGNPKVLIRVEQYSTFDPLKRATVGPIAITR